MAATVEFIAGDKKGVFKYKRNTFHTTNIFRPSFDADIVYSVELQPMQNTATTGRAVAGAAIGGVALGGAGMIAGALVGGKKSEALVTFYFKNGNSALGKCNAPMLEALQVLIFEGKIREGNPHAILPTEHNQGASESESVGDKGSAAIPAPPKKKGGISKKIFMFAVIVLLCVIIDKFGGTEEKTAPEAAPAPATTQQPIQEDPCAGITMETWNNASALWKMTNAQCNPEKQKNTPSEELPKISKNKLESYIKKELPATIKSAEKRHGRDFGSYSIAWPQFGADEGKTYAIQITFSKSILEPMAQEMSTGLVLVALKGLENQGMTLKAMEQHGVMLLGGAACKRGGKTVSYGIAAATPADGDGVIWIPQYSIQ